jgi:hypothetical protein
VGIIKRQRCSKGAGNPFAMYKTFLAQRCCQFFKVLLFIQKLQELFSVRSLFTPTV